MLQILYGLKQTSKTFFEKLRTGLLERGLHQLDHDSSLLTKKDMIVVVYLYDTIIAGPDSDAIDKEISGIGVSKANNIIYLS